MARRLGMLLVMAFLLLLAGPAYEHFQEDIDATTPALEISEGYRTGAVVVGTALMLLTADRATVRARALEADPRDGMHRRRIAGGGAVVAVADAAAAGQRQPRSSSSWACSSFCIVIGVPIAFAFGLATMSYLAFATTTPMSIMPEPHAGRHVAPDPARGAAVRLPRAA